VAGAVRTFAGGVSGVIGARVALVADDRAARNGRS